MFTCKFLYYAWICFYQCGQTAHCMNPVDIFSSLFCFPSLTNLAVSVTPVCKSLVISTSFSLSLSVTTFSNSSNFSLSVPTFSFCTCLLVSSVPYLSTSSLSTWRILPGQSYLPQVEFTYAVDSAFVLLIWTSGCSAPSYCSCILAEACRPIVSFQLFIPYVYSLYHSSLYMFTFH